MYKKELTEEYILSEIKKLRYTYGLNKVIRYNQARDEKYQTQSVAEHIANMIFLAFYFKKYEDPENKLNFGKVIKIILMHDMGEIETGDVIAVSKNIQDAEAEKLAIQKVKINSPDFVAEEIENLFEEYKNTNTPEGQYAKAIDRFEGQLFWIDREGVEMCKDVCTNAGLDINITQVKLIKDIFELLDRFGFKTIAKFLEVVNTEKYKYGIFKEDLNTL